MPGRCCVLNRENELHGALGIVAAALGMDFVSGRSLAAFYAQTGQVGWLGVCLSAVLFGLLIGLLARLAKRSGAQSVGELLSRLPGGGAGKGMFILYGLILLLAAGMLVTSAGRMGALALPVQQADLLAGALALLAAGVLAFAGKSALKALGGALVLLMLVFELALLFFAELPATPRYEIELRLKDNWAAALGFALLHTTACLCLSAGIAVKISGGRTSPARLGWHAGMLFGVLLGVGNAVLMARDVRILALKLPFVALSADWGGAGFYLSAGIGFLFCVFSLAGLIYGILPGRDAANFRGK